MRMALVSLRHTLRHPGFWLLPGCLWLAWVIYASLIPIPTSVDLPGDKWQHFMAYLTLSYLIGCCIERHYLPRLVLAVSAIGLGIEFLQGLTGYRMCEWQDAVANALGATAGAGLAASSFGEIYMWLESRRRP